MRQSAWGNALSHFSTTYWIDAPVARMLSFLPGDASPGRKSVLLRLEEVPSPATMAVLATSLVGLFLAGIQKRRK